VGLERPTDRLNPIAQVHGGGLGLLPRCGHHGRRDAIDARVDVQPLVRILLYDDIRFVIYATVGAVSIGMVVSLAVMRRSRRTQDGAGR
jgi:hypothetical protein